MVLGRYLIVGYLDPYRGAIFDYKLWVVIILAEPFCAHA